MSAHVLGLGHLGATLSRKGKRTNITCKATSSGMERKNNFYRVLSLESQNVSMEEIKKAYRSMALRYHPDVCPPSMKEESARKFVELHKAYETLSDPSSRRMYDNGLRMNQVQRGCKNVVRSEFSRERWEAQLWVLQARSDRCAREKAGLDGIHDDR